MVKYIDPSSLSAKQKAEAGSKGSSLAKVTRKDGSIQYVAVTPSTPKKSSIIRGATSPAFKEKDFTTSTTSYGWKEVITNKKPSLALINPTNDPLIQKSIIQAEQQAKQQATYFVTHEATGQDIRISKALYNKLQMDKLTASADPSRSKVGRFLKLTETIQPKRKILTKKQEILSAFSGENIARSNVFVSSLIVGHDPKYIKIGEKVYDYERGMSLYIGDKRFSIKPQRVGAFDIEEAKRYALTGDRGAKIQEVKVFHKYQPEAEIVHSAINWELDYPLTAGLLWSGGAFLGAGIKGAEIGAIKLTTKYPRLMGKNIVVAGKSVKNILYGGVIGVGASSVGMDIYKSDNKLQTIGEKSAQFFNIGMGIKYGSMALTPTYQKALDVRSAKFKRIGFDPSSKLTYKQQIKLQSNLEKASEKAFKLSTEEAILWDHNIKVGLPSKTNFFQTQLKYKYIAPARKIIPARISGFTNEQIVKEIKIPMFEAKRQALQQPFRIITGKALPQKFSISGSQATLTGELYSPKSVNYFGNLGNKFSYQFRLNDWLKGGSSKVSFKTSFWDKISTDKPFSRFITTGTELTPTYFEDTITQFTIPSKGIIKSAPEVTLSTPPSMRSPLIFESVAFGGFNILGTSLKQREELELEGELKEETREREIFKPFVIGKYLVKSKEVTITRGKEKIKDPINIFKIAPPRLIQEVAQRQKQETIQISKLKLSTFQIPTPFIPTRPVKITEPKQPTTKPTTFIKPIVEIPYSSPRAFRIRGSPRSPLFEIRPVKIDIFPVSDLFSTTITELATGKKATQRKRTKKTKREFWEYVRGKRLLFPTKEIVEGKVDLWRLRL